MCLQRLLNWQLLSSNKKTNKCWRRITALLPLQRKSQYAPRACHLQYTCTVFLGLYSISFLSITMNPLSGILHFAHSQQRFRFTLPRAHTTVYRSENCEVSPLSIQHLQFSKFVELSRCMQTFQVS